MVLSEYGVDGLRLQHEHKLAVVAVGHFDGPTGHGHHNQWSVDESCLMGPFRIRACRATCSSRFCVVLSLHDPSMQVDCGKHLFGCAFCQAVRCLVWRSALALSAHISWPHPVHRRRRSGRNKS